MPKNKELAYKKFMNCEEELERIPYEQELEFYDAIKSGHINKVDLLCQETLADKTGLGKLSHDELQNLKYHFVISVALITRYCIEGGMSFCAAYNLSDYYILSLEHCNTIQAVSDLHHTMCKDYTEKMYHIGKHDLYSRHVSDCIDYIYNHLHTRITIQVLADHCKISPSYLSRVFQQEVSIPVSDFIRNKKVETSKSMLQYSNYSVSEIASILAFPNQSNFTKVFKNQTGMTPIMYRTSRRKKLGI